MMVATSAFSHGVDVEFSSHVRPSTVFPAASISSRLWEECGEKQGNRVGRSIILLEHPDENGDNPG